MQVSLVQNHKGLYGSERSQEPCRTAAPLALTPVGGALPAAIPVSLAGAAQQPAMPGRRSDGHAVWLGT